ncbi:hypothetical protein BKA83DRAFT_4129196 [Pisolithus microcarpus]|nr:hypothetical protein BKA83DRAFT_4133605 [Pisolithus microcarpus]KAI6009261.1 hypothetical protein BKA83DRAFT_4133614 [Pisolithus microcarpus]KAI6010489.1 hypothetical protein BKA83DRAFT_4132708 [Pisolithus microcarpus]KAI6015734.1 hypothetical protein BKA83DRAFT_4129196 [Pisolithus microcarpus]
MLQTFKERSGGAISHRVPPTTLLEKAMFEPREPLTFRIRTTPRPGVRLERDDIPIMRQAFPIRRERSKPHLSQPAVANAPHEVVQDVAAKPTTPSRMSQPNTSQGSGGDSLQAGNPPSERKSTSTSSSRGAAQEPRSPTPGACTPAPQLIPESPQLTALPTRPTADPSTSLPGKWLCPLHPPPFPLDPQSLTLPLKREKRAIRSRRECVQWFKSKGNGSLRSPPDSRSAYDSPLQIADLYIHQNDRESVRQIWMWTGHRWDVADPECTHPIMSEYRLKILGKGEPSWVTRKTMVSDQGRAKRKLES